MIALSEIVGDSAPIVALRDQARRLLTRASEVRRPPPILILGETGTGKGLLARAIQKAGPRAGGPFVEVNCAAIPENLLESEMFGVERGAFTDARQARPGLFQAAHGGTLFLDEVGLMPDALQGKLLKALEDQVVRRVGGTRTEPADVWVVSATSADLQSAVRARRFREDLYHRLAVFVLTVPSLRQRGDDIIALAEHFLAKVCADYGLSPRQLAADARASLLAHQWPGNVRELANVIERAVLLSDGASLGRDTLGLTPPVEADAMPPAGEPVATSLEDAVARTEREHLRAALARTDGNITRAAAAIGVSRDTLRYRIEKYGLRSGADRDPPKSKERPPKRPAPAPVASPPPGPSEPVLERPIRRGVQWVRRHVALVRVALGESEKAMPVHLLVEKVESFGGRVEEIGAAGLLASFGLEPTEDAPQRAASTALAVRNLLAGRAAEHREAPGYRMAIHASRLEVGEGAEGARLDLEAKRGAWQAIEALLGVGDPGTIVVSEAAVPLLLRRFELVPTETTGQTPDRVYRLSGHERAQFQIGQDISPFVGRAREIDLLLGAHAAAVEGRGQPIGIVGEAGIGKSRLLSEFRRHPATQRSEWLHARCASHGTSTPYLPLQGIVRQVFGVTETADPETIAGRLRGGLEEVGLDAEALAPGLLHLLGVADRTGALAALSPEAVRNRMLDDLLTLCRERGRRCPVVLVVEDVHWADRSSEAWLALLAEHVGRSPILLLTTYRPGYRPPWMARSDAMQIALQPLGRQESRAVIEPMLPPGAGGALAERILDRAEGNPFFLEELALSVREQGGDPAGDTVPETVQDVLQARIDRLPDEPRRLLDAAAVLGRTAPIALLRALWDGPGAPDPHIRELARLELLHEDGRGEGTVYTFRHALLQDTTYQGLPETRRRALHAAAAGALAALYPDRVDDLDDRLAYHYSRADQGGQAVEHLVRVAEKAARVYAHAEAVNALHEALEHVERGPSDGRDRRALDLVLRQAHSLNLVGRLPDIVKLLEEHRERLERLDDPALSGAYHFRLAYAWTLMGRPALTVEHARKALDHATRCGDERTMGQACYALAYECFWSGRPVEGVTHAQGAVAHLERVDDALWLGHACWVLGVNHLLMGEFPAALAAAARTLAVGESSGEPRLRSIGAATTGACYALMGEWEAAIAHCRRGLDASLDPVNTALTTGFLGGAYLEKGDIAEAIPLLERAVELCGRVGVRQTEGWFSTLLAEAVLASGQAERAQALAKQGLEITSAIQYRYGIAWAERAHGRIALANGDFVGAGQRLERALGTFCAMGARFEVARTHLVLARLSAATRPEQVGEHLREARTVFEALRLPRYVELSGRVAAELGARP